MQRCCRHRSSMRGMHSIALDNRRIGLRPEADPDTESGRPQDEQWSDQSKNPISQTMESNHDIKEICLRNCRRACSQHRPISGGAAGATAVSAPNGAAPTGVDTWIVPQTQQGGDYWTAERMRAATPATRSWPTRPPSPRRTGSAVPTPDAGFRRHGSEPDCHSEAPGDYDSPSDAGTDGQPYR